MINSPKHLRTYFFHDPPADLLALSALFQNLMHSGPDLSDLETSTTKLDCAIVRYVLFWFCLPIFIELVAYNPSFHLFDVCKRSSTIGLR